jgi:hypothetical protein
LDGGETGGVVSSGRRAAGGPSSRSADDPAIIDLLDTVREVRTTLAIDLSTAAGALDEGQPEVARDILAATSAELPSLRSDEPRPRAGNVAVRRRSLRALITLPAVPLVGAIAMTTAAAVTAAAVHTDGSPHAQRIVASSPAPTAQPTAPAQHTAASTALRRLESVVRRHPKAKQVIAVADDLHKQLTRMIATSTNNPAQLHVVQELLKLEQNVLEGSKVPGTQLALAASRAIAELLQHRPVRVEPKRSVSTRTTPDAKSSPQPKPTTAPTRPHTQPAPHQHQSPSTPHGSPSSGPANPLFGGGLLNWP